MVKVSGGDRAPLAAASSAIVPICFVRLCFTYVVAWAYLPCVVVVVVVAVALVVVLMVVFVLVLVLVLVLVSVDLLALVLVLVFSRHVKRKGRSVLAVMC